MSLLSRRLLFGCVVLIDTEVYRPNRLGPSGTASKSSSATVNVCKSKIGFKHTGVVAGSGCPDSGPFERFTNKRSNLLHSRMAADESERLGDDVIIPPKRA